MRTPETVAHGAIISAGHPLTAQVGFNVLKGGGTAADAAVAAGFAACVVEMASCGVGGYGGVAMVYEAATRRVHCLDFNSCAPLAATPDMFELEPAEARPSANAQEYRTNVKDDANMLGPKAVGVPGMMAGLGLLSERFGRKPWAELIGSAIGLAENGFVAGNHANHVKGVAEKLKREPDSMALLMPGGRPPKPDETIRFPELAATLKLIATDGARAFYHGALAERIAAYSRERDGLLSERDLASYRARLQPPLTMRYRGRDLFTATLGAAAGGTTMFQTLRILEGFDLTRMERLSPEFIHLLAETFKLSWHDRLTRLGDPDFVPVRAEDLFEGSYAAKLRHELRVRLETPPPSATPRGPSAGGTTHVSVVDKDRNMVSMTFTAGGAFGSLVTVPGTGLVFGHGVWRLDPRPGRPNSIQGGKRCLNNMSPLLVFKDGIPVLNAGMPGGRKIVNVMPQVAINFVDFGMGSSEMLATPRCHCEDSEPLLLERRQDGGFPDAVGDALSKFGHQVQWVGGVGGHAHAIVLEDGGRHLRAAPDPRGRGAVLGY